jgi:hypothetical protein
MTVLQEVGTALEQRLSNRPADLITGNPPAMEALLKKGQVVAGTVAAGMDRRSFERRGAVSESSPKAC